eukprot:3941644-Rhodomonas_salina.15
MPGPTISFVTNRHHVARAEGKDTSEASGGRQHIVHPDPHHESKLHTGVSSRNGIRGVGYSSSSVNQDGQKRIPLCAGCIQRKAYPPVGSLPTPTVVYGTFMYGERDVHFVSDEDSRYLGNADRA